MTIKLHFLTLIFNQNVPIDCASPWSKYIHRLHNNHGCLRILMSAKSNNGTGLQHARAKLNGEVNSIFYGQRSACMHDNVPVRLSNSRYVQYFFFKTDRFDLNLNAFLKSNIE